MCVECSLSTHTYVHSHASVNTVLVLVFFHFHGFPFVILLSLQLLQIWPSSTQNNVYAIYNKYCCYYGNIVKSQYQERLFN